MTQPGSPIAMMPPGPDTLVRRVQDLESLVRQVMATNARIQSQLIEEQVAIDALATMPLSALNDTLAIAVSSPSVWTDATCSVSINVPSGFTRCVYTAVAKTGATTSSGGGSFLGAAMSVYKDAVDAYGSRQGAITTTIPTSAASSTVAPFTDVLTGLGSVTAVTWKTWHYESVPANIQAGTLNAGMTVLALFLR